MSLRGWPLSKTSPRPSTEVVADFFDRLERVIPSRLGAGHPIGQAFRPERWRRELEGDLLDAPRLAAAIVARVELRLADVETIADFRLVLEDLRRRSTTLSSLIDSSTEPASPHVVYRLYNRAGILLYVGLTDRGPRRWVEHERSKPWFRAVARFEISRFPTREEAADEERSAIIRERPCWNVVHNSGAAPLYAAR